MIESRDMLEENLHNNYREDFVGYALDLSKKTHKERKNSSAIEVPPDGNYYLDSHRLYTTKQCCELCGTDEKANYVVKIIQDRGQTNERIFFAGLDCLNEHYEIDRTKIESIIKNSSRVRARASKQFGQNFKTTDELFFTTIDMVLKGVPLIHASQLVQELEMARTNLTEQPDAAEIILQRAHFFLAYHQEYMKNPERFKARLNALRIHPGLASGIRKAVERICQTALDQGKEIDFETINELQKYSGSIRKYKNAKSPHQQENFESSNLYIEAVKDWLKKYVSGAPDKAYWRPKDKLTPRTNLGTTHSAMYARYAVKPRELQKFIDDLPKQKWAYTTEPDKTRHVHEDSYIDTSRDEDGFVKNERRIRGSYEYILVAVHALEDRTEVNDLWYKWGRETLETWSTPILEELPITSHDASLKS